jgi:hypothetical protein
LRLTASYRWCSGRLLTVGLDDLADELRPRHVDALNIVRTSDQLQIRFPRLLREFGLSSPTQYNILRILRAKASHCPSWKSPAAPFPLCQALPA